MLLFLLLESFMACIQVLKFCSDHVMIIQGHRLSQDRVPIIILQGHVQTEFFLEVEKFAAQSAAKIRVDNLGFLSQTL